MSITLFGTCRINGVKNHNNLNNLINYTHSTKEVIQQIQFLLGNLSLPEPYDKLCFRTGIGENKPILYNSTLHKLFSESTICIVEICSEKKYIHNDFYLHHLCVDKRTPGGHIHTPKIILDNFECVKQTYAEIENDILEIRTLIEPRKMILVTHYNSKRNGQYIESRQTLIQTLNEICDKHNIPIINPSDALKDFSQDEVMTDDLGHYTPLGLTKFSEYLNEYIGHL